MQYVSSAPSFLEADAKGAILLVTPLSKTELGTVFPKGSEHSSKELNFERHFSHWGFS